MQVWDWEPVKCHDLVEVSWNKVCDLSVNSSFQLVGCNHNQSFCAVWVINLKVRSEYSRVPRECRVPHHRPTGKAPEPKLPFAHTVTPLLVSAQCLLLGGSARRTSATAPLGLGLPNQLCSPGRRMSRHTRRSQPSIEAASPTHPPRRVHRRSAYAIAVHR